MRGLIHLPNLTRVLDAFATRTGFWIAILGLVLTSAWAGRVVEQSVQQLERDKQVFSDRQLRNGFVSMSDIKRVLLIVQSAAERDQFTTGARLEFEQALDILFVRTDNFRRVLRAGETLASAEKAIAALDSIVRISDAALAEGLTDPDTLLRDLVAASEAARRTLVQFLDDMERMQSRVLADQSAAVVAQRNIVQASLVGLTLVGLAALLLLRREVIARRAREQAEQDVAFLAYYDPLTRLPNRAQFQKRLDEALRSAGPVALILVDLDDFKEINDTYGHAAGDSVLCHVGALLSGQAERLGGFAARLGGDEFAIVCADVDLAALTTVARAVLRDVGAGLNHDGEAIALGLSLGIATNEQLGAHLAHTVDSLSRVADFALYASKSGGRSRFTVYDQDLEQRFLERRAMIDELPTAIENGHLTIFLQPKVRLPMGQPYGFEALVRWQRGGECVPPDVFITVAEDSGLIVELDRYVLMSAAATVSAFNRDSGTAFSVSVNMSAVHFTNHRVVGWIQEALTRSRLPPPLLTVEITETVELRDWNRAQAVMQSIRALGVRIAIDDFGTGYSSLSYLRTTIADELKIDRSMVEQIETSQKARFLLDGVLEMAQNLDLEVVVEGVETQDQADALEAMGAVRAQGYLYGRPIPALEALTHALNAPRSFARTSLG